MKGPGADPAWVALDWGTSHLRAWVMGADGTMLGRRDSDMGVGRLTPNDFEPTLDALFSDMAGGSKLTAICCGMAGSRQGWAEAPYAATPCMPPAISDATRVSAANWEVHILPGVKQETPADVMRGEETQIAGFLTQEPGFDGVLCLPGTHNKWVRISAGEIVSFRTFMSGELFALLSTKSVLRHSVATEDWDQCAFDEALSETLSRPGELAAKLFSLRAENLLHDLPPAAARARLSAYLIGAELAAAKPYWLGQQVAVLGEGRVASSYEHALLLQGVATTRLDAEQLTLAGLRAAFESLVETQS